MKKGGRYRLSWRQGVAVVFFVLMIGTSSMQGTSGKNDEKNHDSLQMQDDAISLNHIKNQQSSPSNEWDGVFGGSKNDRGNWVRQTTDGGFIVTGYTNATEFGTGDIWFIKTDAHGREQWNKTFGGEYGDYGSCVQLTRDGGYVLTGVVDEYIAMMIRSSVGLIKTDKNGNELWSKKFHLPNHSPVGKSVAQTPDGGYIIVANSNSFGVPRYLWLIKTDENGTELWNRTFGGLEGGLGFSVGCTTDGGYIAAGVTYVSGHPEEYLWLLKIDENGSEQWNRTFGGSAKAVGYEVLQTSDGGYIITGRKGVYGSGKSDAWLVKTDGNGREQWNRTFGGSNDDSGGSVQQTVDGGYVISGSTSSFGAGSADLWIIRTDEHGTELWNRTLGGTGDEGGGSIQQTSDGLFIVTGITTSFGAGYCDVWLLKIADAPEPKKRTAFIIGTLLTLDTDGVFITFQAQDLWYVQLLPPTITHYTNGEYITASQEHFGILRPRVVCGFFKTRA